MKEADFIIGSKRPLEYAKEACDTMMKKYQAVDLPPKGRFHYHQGVFLSGMQEVYELSNETVYGDYIKEWVDSFVFGTPDYEYDTGQHDDIQPGVLLFRLFEETKNKTYLELLKKLTSLVKEFPTTKEGGLWHKKECKEQMWLDGLYMAGPICAQYARDFDEPELFDFCVRQILLMKEKTRDEKTGLWYHAWDESHTMPWSDPVTGCSPEFWGRSIGWVPVAILEELDYVPKDHKAYSELVHIVTDLLKAVCRYQDAESGLWYQVVDKGNMEGNWLESSCTCLFAAAILKAVRKGILEGSYLFAAEKGYKGIQNRIRYNEQGMILDKICVGTGVGDYKHYCNRPTSENDLHGVGAYLLMCAEAERMERALELSKNVLKV